MPVKAAPRLRRPTNLGDCGDSWPDLPFQERLEPQSDIVGADVFAANVSAVAVGSAYEQVDVESRYAAAASAPRSALIRSTSLAESQIADAPNPPARKRNARSPKRCAIANAWRNVRI